MKDIYFLIITKVNPTKYKQIETSTFSVRCNAWYSCRDSGKRES